MGTNYYRIPGIEEIEKRKAKLIKRVEEINPADAHNANHMYSTIPDGEWDFMSPWDEFIKDAYVHLGKRSMGWKFCWNFHDNHYYSNKQELLEFIKSGRILDEYGEEIDADEFIEMAMEWGQPEGFTFNAEYQAYMIKEHPGYRLHSYEYFDTEVDGLRVSSSTDFC